MKDLIFYDFDFNLLAVENKYMYINWTLKYNDVGNFEAHLPMSSKIVKLVLDNEYLIVCQGDNQAIITGKQINKNLIIYGRTINWLLTKRVTPKFSRMTNSPEAICASLVEDAFSDIENFVVKRYTEKTFDDIDFWRNVYNPTEKVVSECLDRIDAGHRVYADVVNKNWVYEMILGKEIPLVISGVNKNAFNESYIEDFQNHLNGGWYESYSDDENSEPIWEYIESPKTGIYKWIGVLGGQSLSEANTSLYSRRWKKEISLETNKITYGIDYNLGDDVKLQMEFGDYKKTISKKIKGVEIAFENGILTQQPIFY